MFISVFILAVEVDNSFCLRVYVPAWQSEYLFDQCFQPDLFVFEGRLQQVLAD